MKRINKPEKRAPGRPKGSPNKVTAETRVIFRDIMKALAPKVKGWIAKVALTDPARATELLLRVAEFHVPKLARMEFPIASADGEGEGFLEVRRVPRSQAAAE